MKSWFLVLGSVLCVVVYVFSLYLSNQRRLEEVTTHRNARELIIVSTSGIVVITDLECVDAPSLSLAKLPTPITIVDSGSARISAASLAHLTWKDLSGQTVPAPTNNAALRAIYYREVVSQ